jgi:alpha-galactosidase
VAQSQAQVSMWAILKSPMLASADFSNVSQQLIDVLSNDQVLAVSDDLLGKEVGVLPQMACVLRSVQFAA